MNGQFSHVVYFWLNEPDNHKVRDRFEKALSLLVESSENAHDYHLGKAEPSDRAVVDDTFTYSLMINFATKVDHDKYQVEPAHLKFVDENKDLWDRVVVYDSSKF